MADLFICTQYLISSHYLISISLHTYFGFLFLCVDKPNEKMLKELYVIRILQLTEICRKYVLYV